LFDLSVDALVPVDVNADFNIISMFFNFDTEQVDPAPEQIYLWDDIEFVEGSDAGVVDGSVNWNSACGDREASLAIYAAGTSDLLNTYDVVVDANGAFSVEIQETGSVDLYIKVEGYLAKVAAGVEVGSGSNEVSFGDIIGGDINGSNSIGIQDYGVFSAAFGSAMGDPAFNTFADLNCDMEIGIQDYGPFSAAFGTDGDAPEE